MFLIKVDEVIANCECCANDTCTKNYAEAQNLFLVPTRTNAINVCQRLNDITKYWHSNGIKLYLETVKKFDREDYDLQTEFESFYMKDKIRPEVMVSPKAPSPPVFNGSNDDKKIKQEEYQKLLTSWREEKKEIAKHNKIVNNQVQDFNSKYRVAKEEFFKENSKIKSPKEIDFMFVNEHEKVLFGKYHQLIDSRRIFSFEEIDFLEI